ncbi:thiamine phosphate synthase [Flavobacterium sp. P4023]|uniref:Thiamine-phosphate synthase n=1 Tax=Flavobacterium flabelliforme TaxID=2816119 RepID=A0ABS5CQA0_9FLAO|nr:thiamine phosphate synthase [Flavobacterium flabelliforme]MBP4140799.1 thiamine phosphate synthase [Flavobacterium flabelliforme]
MYNKLQYISQGNTVEEQITNIRKALDNGCEWIQLRFKTQNTMDLFNLAESTKILCDVYSANYIINDNVYLAQQFEADGVHLGLTDMKISEARQILGDTKMIGGTANTFADIQQRSAEQCDYIGLGPFQHTDTKENLSPILGIEGYRSILKKVKSKKIAIPIYAIGGIALENIEILMETGIYGIAVSSLITKSEKPKKLISQLNEKIYGSVTI